MSAEQASLENLPTAIRAWARIEAQKMCCYGTGECGIGHECGEDRARFDALNDAADVVAAALGQKKEGGK